MSSVSSTTAPVLSYQDYLQNAQEAYDTSRAALDKLNADKANAGSIASQIDQIVTKNREIAGTPKVAENFADLKNQFVQFLNAQLETLPTVEKARDAGLKAIETIRAAQKHCAGFKADDASFIKKMANLGYPTNPLEARISKTDAQIKEYKFDEQLSTLNKAVASTTELFHDLKTSLSTAYYTKKVAEEATKWTDSLPSFASYFYLNAALEEKNKPAAAPAIQPATSNA